jgi:hypothetical protein
MRTRKVLTNEEINKVAKAGISFRPIEGNTGDRACDCFVRYDEKEKALYTAVFNYNSSEKKVIMLDLERLGLDKDKEYVMYDLWSKTKLAIKSNVTIVLSEAEPKLFKISEK